MNRGNWKQSCKRKIPRILQRGKHLDVLSMIVTLVKRTRYCYATFPRTLCRVVTPQKENRNSYIKSGVTDTIETFIVPRIYSWLGRKDRVNPSKKTIDGGRDKAI